MKVLKRCVAGVAMLFAASSIYAAETIQVWHALQPSHQAVFESLVKRFNKEQKDVVVKLESASSFEALQTSVSQAFQRKQAPHLVQLPDLHAPEAVAKANRITPLYELLAKHPIADLQWFLPQTTSFVRDNKGRLLALPFMAEVPVLFYNRDLYKKAGLDPDTPPRTWAELQAHLLKLQAAGIACPYASSRTVWIHQENLAAVNNKPFATRGNGFEGGATKLLINDMLHIRHMALMTSWVRSRLFTQASEDNQSDVLFAMGECAVLSSGTGAWAQLEKVKFSTGVAPLPYSSESSKTAGAPLVGGSSLWAVSGHSAAAQKATAAFIAWLASPTVAAHWHQATGFLPLTDAAARAADVSFYKKIPGAQQVVQSVKNAPGQNSRGLRLPQYQAVQNVLAEETMAALTGKKPPMKAQTDAVDRTTPILARK